MRTRYLVLNTGTIGPVSNLAVGKSHVVKYHRVRRASFRTLRRYLDMTLTPLELVFAQVDGLDIALDVFVPDSATEQHPAPVLLWWHG